MSSIIAIDFGNTNCIVTTPKNGNINFLNNQASQRLTPSMVSFGEYRRYFGIFAHQKQMENLSGTITQLKQLVGLKYETVKRQTIEILESCKLVPGPTGFTFLEFNFLDKKCTFSVEQCIAFLLKGCFNIAKLNNIFTDQCVIVISPWWNEIERRVIMDSAKVAGIKVAKLINSTTAEAIAYYMDHKNKIKEQKTSYGLFIDFGDCGLSSAVIHFHDDTIEVKSYYCDDSISGSNFTIALVNYLLKVTEQKYKINPSKDHRAMIRFINAAEKLKKSLSINPVMPFEVDSLLNGVSINFLVKRTEFEDQIHNLIGRIEYPIEKSIQLANIEKKDIFTIEILGGTSRIPAVKAKINKMFNKEPTQSVNPDECFAIGAGFQAAILSPQFSTKLNVKDAFYYQIFIECEDFQENDHKKELFKQFQIIPCQKILTHHVRHKTKIRIFCQDTILLGTVKIRLRGQSEAKVQITFCLNQNGIIEVPKVTLLQNPLSENSVDFKYKPKFGHPDVIIENLIQQEKAMEDIDKKEDERDDAKNSLESYLFTLKNALERDYTDFFDPSLINEYTQKVDNTNNWFYQNEDERISAREYIKKLDDLKSFGDPAFKRKKKRENLFLVISRLVDRAESCRKKIPDVDFLTSAQINDELNQYIASLRQLEKDLENTPKYTDISIEEKELSDPVYRIEKKVNSL